MGDLTLNISRHELRCKCGRCNCQTMDWETVEIVQQTCQHFAQQNGQQKVVLLINSAHRCEAHNAAVGGAPKSSHLQGNAMDIAIKGVSPQEIYDYLDEQFPDRLGLGLYRSFVHIDTRKGKARW